MANIPPVNPPLNPPGVQPPSPPPALPVAPLVVPGESAPAFPPPLRPYGDVNPPRPPPPLSVKDARTWALRALLDYLSGVPFVRPGALGGQVRPPRPMPILRENMHTSTPSTDLVMPSLVCLSGPIEKVPRGMSPQPDESSWNVWGKDTVLVPQHSHVEVVPIEMWGSRSEEAKAFLGGLEGSLSPTEGAWGVRLVLPLYFNQVACFRYERDEHPQDDAGAVRNRWRVVAHVWMEVDVVALVNTVTMLPVVTVDTETTAYSPLAVLPPRSFGNLKR